MKKLLTLILSLLIILSVALCGCGNKVELGNVLILGDSYSTFEGYTTAGYESWYSTRVNTNHTDVFDVKDTWWWQVIEGTKSELKENSSYSGSLISDAKGTAFSFITRFYALTSSHYFEQTKIDTVFVYGGLNDYWNGVGTGQLKFSDWTDQDLKYSYSAFTYLLNEIRTALPDARVIVIMDETLPYNMRVSFAYAASYYDMESIVPTKISKQNSHPNKAGMKSISTQILEYLENYEKESK